MDPPNPRSGTILAPATGGRANLSESAMVLAVVDFSGGLLRIRLNTLWHPRRLIPARRIAASARRTSSPTATCIWAFPWALDVRFTNPAGAVASCALHAHD